MFASERTGYGSNLEREHFWRNVDHRVLLSAYCETNLASLARPVETVPEVCQNSLCDYFLG